MVRRHLLALTLAGIVSNAGPASAQLSATTPSSQIAAASTEHADWEARMTRYYAVWSPGQGAFSIERAAPFYKQHPDLFAFESQAGVDSLPPSGVVGWRAYRDAYTGVMANFSDFRVVPSDDLRVWRNGDIAWTANTFRTQGQVRNGPSIAGGARATLVWERGGDGEWRIVHEHISPLPG